MGKKILILAHMRHGKDTFAEILNKHFEFDFKSSSQAAADIFLYDELKDKYGYKTEDFPVVFREYQRIISLPLYPRMTDQDVASVIEAVVDVVTNFKR